ncbi:uncharacterized protein LOC135090825 [Scylla paramamosain]|uniref:uncharacterized protein LOC135090825 n=1 Tax=Scylla paramamosain TaxID=85552 RepID=UPI00308330C0
MGHMQNMVWSRPVPTIGKFSGRVRKASELDDWVEDATEKIKQLGLQGSEGVSYLCGFLEGPARRRVRNSTVKTVSDLFDCLRSAFGPELNYADLEKQLHARVQQPGEGVWEFADSLGVIVDKMYKVRDKGDKERQWLLTTWFCRNLRDRKVGVKLGKWWEKHQPVKWEDMVQRAADQVSEAERIVKEEAELVSGKKPERVVRSTLSSPSCSLCGQHGHLGYQCERFKELVSKTAGKRESLRTRGQLSRPDDRVPTTAQIRSVTNVTEERNDVKRGKVKLFGKTLRIDALVNGIPVSALADSSAEVSLVTEEWYKQHLLPKQAVIYGMDIRITDANGREIPCLGYVKVNVEIEGKSVKDCGLFVKGGGGESGVVQGTTLPVLFGMNVLKGAVHLGLTEKWGRCVRAIEAKLRVTQQPLGFAVIQQQQDLVIPAGTRRIMRVFVESLQEVDVDSVVLEPLVPGEGYWVPEGLCIFPSYTRVVKGEGWLSVGNLGQADVQFRPQWKVAKVSHGREVTVGRAHTHTVAQTAPPSVVKEFRDRLGVQVDESQLDSAQLERLDGLIHEYGDVFAENEQDLGCATGVEHEIHLNSAVPIRLPYRHIPPPCITEVKAHVKGLLEQGVIEESVSPYAAPIVMVRKKDGSLRLCVDYRRLNEVTVKDAFPLPRVQDTLDALAGAQYFSSFDLAAGYHQILVRAEDRPKTAFVTPFGHYQYVRCPMGLSNSPATFQRFMEYVFSDQVFVTLLVYLDDLLVFARSVDEHLDRLEGMLKLLRKHGLKLKPSKCHILKPQVRYL